MDQNKNLTPETENELPPIELLTLEDENGIEITFEIIASLEYEGERYVGVVEYYDDLEETPSDLPLVILHVGTDDQGDYYDIVEDDEELYQVSEALAKLLEEEYTIES